MKPQLLRVLMCLFSLWAAVAVAPWRCESSPPSRTFLFIYQLTLTAIPSGARRVRVWIPRPGSDANQTVALKRAEGSVPLRETRERVFGNHMLYGEILNPSSGSAKFTLEYQVRRNEYSKGNLESLTALDAETAGDLPPRLTGFLQADRLVPVQGRIKGLADQQTQGLTGTVRKARSLYDYVFRTVRYDKSGTGWGRGDSLWVCDSRHGNCTDFHSLFISLARAEGIPARFEIGFPLPAAAQGTIPGYHCWAEFYVRGPGWVPVDISEAWKNPAKHDYYFGTLDPNRVQFSIGRDLILEPKQDGPPLNYFVYPYVEVDGVPFEGIEKQFSFRDVGTNM